MKNFIMGVLFLIVGIVVTLIGRSMLHEAGESENWPSTSGVIEASTVVQSREYDSSKKKSKTVYRANIDYTYQVDGKKFYGDKISFGGTTTDRKAAYKLTSKYPKNAQVSVYYSPDEPENSVLEPGKTWLTYIPFGSGILFAFVGVCLTLKPVLKVLLVAILALSKR